jgi:hypothetical protein
MAETLIKELGAIPKKDNPLTRDRKVRELFDRMEIPHEEIDAMRIAIACAKTGKSEMTYEEAKGICRFLGDHIADIIKYIAKPSPA